MTTFRIDTSAILRLREKFKSLEAKAKIDIVQRAMGKSILIIEAQVQKNVRPAGGGPKVRSGRFFGSISSDVRMEGDSIVGLVGSGLRLGREPVFYAPYIEEGTRPHDIFPRNKQALAFSVGRGKKGKVVVKSVHHPGTKAYRPFGRAVENESTMGRFRDVFIQTAFEEVEKAIK